MSEMLPQESYVITCYVIFYVQYPKVRYVEKKPRLSDVEFKKMSITYGYEFYDPFMNGHISIINMSFKMGTFSNLYHPHPEKRSFKLTPPPAGPKSTRRVEPPNETCPVGGEVTTRSHCVRPCRCHVAIDCSSPLPPSSPIGFSCPWC